jgi:plasmid stabilization system protein ParE
MRLRYTGRAREDVEIAFAWYEEQRHGLGLDFLHCMEAAIETIIRMPKMYAKHHSIFRRALVKRFPFSIFYTLEKKGLIIHAVFDNRQDPARLP